MDQMPAKSAGVQIIQKRLHYINIVCNTTRLYIFEHVLDED